MIGKIQRIELRSVWPHEAHNFTKWLQENIDVINDAIDLDITNLEKEKAAGSFNVDREDIGMRKRNGPKSKIR